MAVLLLCPLLFALSLDSVHTLELRSTAPVRKADMLLTWSIYGV